MHAFFEQLWQRPILRTAAAYVVLAWLVVQVASVLIPAFELPDAALRLVILLTILGLPAVLIGAWGMAARHGGATQETPAGTAVDLLVIALVCVAAAIAAREVPETLEGETLQASVVRPTPARARLEANSLAVLPFAALSDSQEDSYFADGLTEDLLNTLARIPGLRVVGRTSVFYYKGRNEDLRTIAEELNVRYVIEGSVRRDGDRLRISIQLIEADSGFNLWSATFDRLNENILEIQSTIAEQVARVLRARLTGESDTVIASAPGDMVPSSGADPSPQGPSPQGSSPQGSSPQSSSPQSSSPRGAAQRGEATQAQAGQSAPPAGPTPPTRPQPPGMDPPAPNAFPTLPGPEQAARAAQAAAQAASGRRLFLIGLARLRQRGLTNIQAAISLFEQALTLDQDNAETLSHLASARLLHADLGGKRGDQDYEEAEAEATRLLERALNADPQCATAYAVRGLLFLQRALIMGRFTTDKATTVAAAKADLERAIALDPRNVEALLWYGIVLRDLELDAVGAQAQFDRVLQIDPLYQRGLQNSVQTLTDLGRFDEARGLLRQLLKLYPESAEGFLAAAQFEAHLGRQDGAIKFTFAAYEREPRDKLLLNLADLYEILGDVSSTRRIYQRLVAHPDHRHVALLYLDFLDGDFEGALEILDTYRDRFSDEQVPIIRSVLAIKLERFEDAAAELRKSNPEFFSGALPPFSSDGNAGAALLAALVLQRMGDRAQAEKLLSQLETWYSPKPPLFDNFCFKTIRSAVQTLRGRPEDALNTLEGAVDQGLARVHGILCGLMPGPAATNPFFTSLADTPRFQGLMERIAERAAAQLSRVRLDRMPGAGAALGQEL